MRPGLSILAALWLSPAFARADAVYLQGGRVLEGNASVAGDKVIVELESGRVSFPRADVLRIESSTSARDLARSREQKLRPDDLAGILELANYCRDHDLPAKERELLERIVARDPDHAEARRRLGYVREGKLWLRRSELARREADSRREQRERQHADKRRQLELEEAALRRDRAEAELATARAQLEREREAQRAQPYPSWYNPLVVVPGRGGWTPRGPALQHNPPPNQPNYPINGVRSPGSYVDEAQRNARGLR